MAKPKVEELNAIAHRFIEEAGNATQAFGLGRVVGQIYAYAYFSPTPRNLADMQEDLGISKGSASTGVRQLEQWNAVRKVWVKGDRKDYYEANDWFGKILKNVILDTMGKRLYSYTTLLDELEQEMAVLDADDADDAFIKDRIEHLRKFHERADALWNNPLLQRLLK